MNIFFKEKVKMLTVFKYFNASTTRLPFVGEMSSGMVENYVCPFIERSGLGCAMVVGRQSERHGFYVLRTM